MAALQSRTEFPRGNLLLAHRYMNCGQKCVLELVRALQSMCLTTCTESRKLEMPCGLLFFFVHKASIKVRDLLLLVSAACAVECEF